MRTTQERIHADTQWLLDAWDPLREARHKGTPRPWKQTDLTPEQRAELDAQARAEKLEHGAFVLGESPAPLHLDILDRTINIRDTTRDLARILADTVFDGPTLVYLTRVRNPSPALMIEYIQYAAQQLEATAHDELLRATASTLHDLRVETAAHFAEIIDGQRLKAECPWCGGEKLKFRLIGHTNPELVVRCETGICEPPPADCGAWTGRGFTLPTWPQWEWTWLADRINHHENKDTRK